MLHWSVAQDRVLQDNPDATVTEDVLHLIGQAKANRPDLQAAQNAAAQVGAPTDDIAEPTWRPGRMNRSRNKVRRSGGRALADTRDPEARALVFGESTNVDVSSRHRMSRRVAAKMARLAAGNFMRADANASKVRRAGAKKLPTRNKKHLDVEEWTHCLAVYLSHDNLEVRYLAQELVLCAYSEDARAANLLPMAMTQPRKSFSPARKVPQRSKRKSRCTTRRKADSSVVMPESRLRFVGAEQMARTARPTGGVGRTLGLVRRCAQSRY